MNDTQVTDVENLKKYFEDVNKETADMAGNTIYDVINSFNYIKKYANDNNLTDSVFGSSLAGQADQVIQILQQLRTCYTNLSMSIDTFVNEQRAANNGTV